MMRQRVSCRRKLWSQVLLPILGFMAAALVLLVVRKVLFHTSGLLILPTLLMVFIAGGLMAAWLGSRWQDYLSIGSMHLGWTRIVVGSALLVLAWREDITSTLIVPAEYFHAAFPWSSISSWVMNPRSESTLLLVQWLTRITLVTTILGLFTRLSMVLAALGYTLFYSVQISYTHFFHSGLIPLHMLYVLLFFRCQDGISLDQVLRKGEIQSDCLKRHYTLGMLSVTLIYVLSYYFSAISKWKSRPFWADAQNIKSQLLSDDLSLVHPLGDLNVIANLLQWGVPDGFFSALGIATLVLETAPVLMLVSVWGMRIVPILLAGFHIGIFLINKFVFIDLILLPLIYLPFWLRSQPLSQKAKFPDADSRFKDVLLPAAIVTILACGWLLRIEKFPLFTQWAMYSGYMYEAQYVQMYATTVDGRRFKTDLSKAIGFLGDAKWLDLVRKPEPDNKQQNERLNQVMDTFMYLYNAQTAQAENIQCIELEYRVCHPSFEGIQESKLIYRWVRRLERELPANLSRQTI
jgi:hypothetical protein